MQVELNMREDENLYYYQNWQSDQKNKIHNVICGNCRYGTGKHSTDDRGVNGVWIGPFSERSEIHEYVKGLKLPDQECKICLKLTL